MFSVWRAFVSFFMNMEMRSQYGENLHRIVNGIQIAAAHAGTLRISISYHNNRNINWTHSPHVAISFTVEQNMDFAYLNFTSTPFEVSLIFHTDWRSVRIRFEIRLRILHTKLNIS